MSAAAAAVLEFFPHYLQFLVVSIREHYSVAQPIAAATASAAPFPDDVVTLRAHRP